MFTCIVHAYNMQVYLVKNTYVCTYIKLKHLITYSIIIIMDLNTSVFIVGFNIVYACVHMTDMNTPCMSTLL